MRDTHPQLAKLLERLGPVSKPDFKSFLEEQATSNPSFNDSVERGLEKLIKSCVEDDQSARAMATALHPQLDAQPCAYAFFEQFRKTREEIGFTQNVTCQEIHEILRKDFCSRQEERAEAQKRSSRLAALLFTLTALLCVCWATLTR